MSVKMAGWRLRLPRLPLPARTGPPAERPLAPYARGGLGGWYQAILYVALVAACIAYGAAFAIYAPHQMVMFAAPLGIMALLVIWALPKVDVIPARLLQFLFLAFFISLFMWPNYIAISLPGLPWVTMLRMFGLPLALTLMTAISMSKSFRAAILDTLRADPILVRLLLLFLALQTFSIVFSNAKGLSINKYIVAQTNWTAIFFVACFLFRRPGFAELWAKILLFMAYGLCLIGIWEARLGQAPWVGHIPSFLKIQDEAVTRAMTGVARAWAGTHRVTATSTTPLGLAELLSLTSPFAIHFLLNRYSLLLRLMGAAYLPLSLLVITLADSRLGIVCTIVGVMIYLLLWGLLGWRQRKGSLLSPAVVLAYPALFTAAVSATFFIGRLRKAVWGGGAQQPSTEARNVQWEMGWPKILDHPLGHGIGRAAQALGYYAVDTLTIDSYWLSVLLDYGILGFIAYYLIFIRGFWVGATTLVSAREDRETKLLLPLSVSLIGFVVIKAVFSQEDNHPLMFMMIAAVLALTARARAARAESQVA